MYDQGMVSHVTFYLVLIFGLFLLRLGVRPSILTLWCGTTTAFNLTLCP